MGNADSKERTPVEGSGLILFSSDHSKLLLVRDANYKKYGFPKGKHEEIDASELETATRECKEETGLDAEDYIVFPGSFRLGKYSYRYATLIGDSSTKVLKKGPNSEIHSLLWVSLDTLLRGETPKEMEFNMPLRFWISDIRHEPTSQASQLYRTYLEKRARKRTQTRRRNRRRN